MRQLQRRTESLVCDLFSTQAGHDINLEPRGAALPT